MASSVSAAPSSRNAVWVKATKSGVGMPWARRRCLVMTLSIAREQASTPDPV